jgi:hypothetical protein
MWKILADTYNSDSELGTKSCRVKFLKPEVIRCTRAWVAFINNPPITNLRMEVYTDNNNAKGSLLYTSTNTLTKAQMITLANGIKEIYFTFADVQLDNLNYYHFVLNGVASGMSESSCIAWKHGFPDNIYRTGLTLAYEEMLTSPYDLYFQGAEL